MSKNDQRLAQALFFEIEVKGMTAEDAAKKHKMTYKRAVNVLACHPDERRKVLDGFKGQIRKRIDSTQVDIEDFIEGCKT